jgi:tRNA(Ile2) C34 agmatinyltransferase TiaS
MDDSALKAALRKLLAHGEAAKDASLTKFAASKKVVPPVAPEKCPECGAEMVGGKCEACGYEAEAEGAEDGELASLLESGAQE